MTNPFSTGTMNPQSPVTRVQGQVPATSVIVPGQAPGITLIEDPNELPPLDPNTALASPQEVRVHSYHSEVTGYSGSRICESVVWAKEGHFAIDKRPFACIKLDQVTGEYQDPLICTIVKADLQWQYWDNNALKCSNDQPGVKTEGLWREGDRTFARACGTCAFNEGKGCKDSWSLRLKIIRDEREETVQMRTQNFLVTQDFDRFLRYAQNAGFHLKTSTLAITPGKQVQNKFGVVTGWRIKVLDPKNAVGDYYRAKMAEQA